MKKLLMTDKKDILHTQFFDPNKIIFIDSEIPFERIKEYKEEEWVLGDDFSPTAFFDWFHSLLIQHSLITRFK